MSDNGYMLIALCASYINTETRLKHFFIMLNSWIHQEHLIPYLHISTSIVDDTLLEQFEDMRLAFTQMHLEKLKDKILGISVSRKVMKQFQHYKHIIDKNPELIEDNPWIMFTDDDDIWHPLRTVMYASTIQQIMKEYPTVNHINIPCYVESSELDKKDYTTSFEIDEDIKKGYIKQLQSNENYVCSCVKIELLYYFFLHSTDELLNCIYADVKFRYFLVKHKDTALISEPWEQSWMYFYRHVKDLKDSITNDKHRLPSSILYSDELNIKFNSLNLTPLQRKNFISSLCNVEANICRGDTDINIIRKKDEQYQMENGVLPKHIHEVMRPLYPIIDEFLQHSYYTNLKKNI